MPIPYNVFGLQPHRRWIVADGGGWANGEWCYSTKLVPQGPEDWEGPFLFPQEPGHEINRGHSMASIEYDPVNDVFMITGTIAGAWDFTPGPAQLDYPNASPYIKLSYDLMDTWTDAQGMADEWLNVEPTFWSNFSVGHLHYDAHRNWWWMFGSTVAGTLRPDTDDHVSISIDGGLTWSVMTDQRNDPATDDYDYGTYSWFISQARGIVCAVGGSAITRSFTVTSPPGTPNSRQQYVYARYGTGSPAPGVNTPQDTPSDPGVPAAYIPGSEPITQPGPGVAYNAQPQANGFDWIIGGDTTGINPPNDPEDGSYFAARDPDLNSAILADPAFQKVYSVETGLPGADLEIYEENIYENASGVLPSPGPSGNTALRHAKLRSAGGRIWTMTGYGGASVFGLDQFISTQTFGVRWRRDQDFTLFLNPAGEPGGIGLARQHPWFDHSKYPNRCSVNDIAHNRANSQIMMMVGQCADIDRNPGALTRRDTVFSTSTDGGRVWSPPYQLPMTHQPFYVWSV